MPAKVADASVLGAIVFNEPERFLAENLLEEAELYEPTLLPYELTSIARKKSLRYPEQREAFRQYLLNGTDLEAQMVLVDEVAVLDLALITGLGTYDASYLWVARTVGADLVTFDRRLEAAARNPES